DMKIKAQMDPAMMYDSTLIPAGTAETLDPWEMRKRLGVDGEVNKAIQTIIPEGLMKVGSEPFEWLKYIGESQDYYLGMNQLSALAKAKMSTGQEGADDLLRMAGPIVRHLRLHGSSDGRRARHGEVSDPPMVRHQAGDDIRWT